MNHYEDKTPMAPCFIDDQGLELVELSTGEMRAVSGGVIPAVIGLATGLYGQLAATTWTGAFFGRVGWGAAVFGAALVFGGDNAVKGNSIRD